ncbi:hypothetical protein CY34DRAFT_88704 [Suillus luteus UH-Slu-Lm8-n1]|uniref:non-specific serine/threonine protein kinase n=1 Tax=Suillus luteus UH-Slu-Lm8-n1 TaxID=930992 RepID=A0A0D0B7C8_9AGAM|nr:hypothetical protein CY34DRAFT_88704 [Suillus luteus UH-Slu-Lm8-n1]
MDVGTANLTSKGTTEVSTPKNVDGPFRILRHLSSGGFAKAMGAQDMASERLLCLKVFRKDRLKKHGTEEGLLNELEVYKHLASSKECCPATIFLMELEVSFQTKNYVCFVMDLMSRDLWCFIKNDYEYCLEHARRWIAQVVLGINALHMIGIIHRDIKSENILIDMQENVRIADFGLSYVYKEPVPLNTWGGYSSRVKGTVCFMAPEILRNAEKGSFAWYGAPVDWWLFGCVLYELVSPAEHNVRIASYLVVILLVSPTIYWIMFRGTVIPRATACSLRFSGLIQLRLIWL